MKEKKCSRKQKQTTINRNQNNNGDIAPIPADDICEHIYCPLFLFEEEKMDARKEIVKPLDANGKPMMTPIEVCEMLGVCRSWLSKQCNPSQTRITMPYRKVGKRIWFVAEQIAEWNTQRRFD
jgi:hypothetical protein